MDATEGKLAYVGKYGDRVFKADEPELAAEHLTPNVKWHGRTLGPPWLS